MQKLILIILSMIYFGVSSGMSLSLHYCGKNLQKINLFHSDSDEKGCCGEKKMNCCKDKFLSLKKADNHTLMQAFKVSIKAFFDLYLEFPITELSNIIISSQVVIPLCHAPPDLSGVPIYLQIRTLLI